MSVTHRIKTYGFMRLARNRRYDKKWMNMNPNWEVWWHFIWWHKKRQGHHTTPLWVQSPSCLAFGFPGSSRDSRQFPELNQLFVPFHVATRQCLLVSMLFDLSSSKAIISTARISCHVFVIHKVHETVKRRWNTCDNLQLLVFNLRPSMDSSFLEESFGLKDVDKDTSTSVNYRQNMVHDSIAFSTSKKSPL